MTKADHPQNRKSNYQRAHRSCQSCTNSTYAQHRGGPGGGYPTAGSK